MVSSRVFGHEIRQRNNGFRKIGVSCLPPPPLTNTSRVGQLTDGTSLALWPKPTDFIGTRRAIRSVRQSGGTRPNARTSMDHRHRARPFRGEGTVRLSASRWAPPPAAGSCPTTGHVADRGGLVNLAGHSVTVGGLLTWYQATN